MKYFSFTYLSGLLTGVLAVTAHNNTLVTNSALNVTNSALNVTNSIPNVTNSALNVTNSIPNDVVSNVLLRSNIAPPYDNSNITTLKILDRDVDFYNKTWFLYHVYPAREIPDVNIDNINFSELNLTRSEEEVCGTSSIWRNGRIVRTWFNKCIAPQDYYYVFNNRTANWQHVPKSYIAAQDKWGSIVEHIGNLPSIRNSFCGELRNSDGENLLWITVENLEAYSNHTHGFSSEEEKNFFDALLTELDQARVDDNQNLTTTLTEQLNKYEDEYYSHHTNLDKFSAIKVKVREPSSSCDHSGYRG